jgi:hypothetical protein
MPSAIMSLLIKGMPVTAKKEHLRIFFDNLPRGCTFTAHDLLPEEAQSTLMALLFFSGPPRTLKSYLNGLRNATFFAAPERSRVTFDTDFRGVYTLAQDQNPQLE